MIRPFVVVRLVGMDPRSAPKVLSWSEKSIARLVSRDRANATASASLAASRPSSAASFFAHVPGGGK
jgi:hypothetical protein